MCKFVQKIFWTTNSLFTNFLQNNSFIAETFESFEPSFKPTKLSADNMHE